MPVDKALAEQQARTVARSIWDNMRSEFGQKKQRGRATITQVVRDGSGRTVGATASIDGSLDQTIIVDHGQALGAGDVLIVENDGSPSVASWRAVRKVTSTSAVPSAGELIALPSPTGLTLTTGTEAYGPGMGAMAWIFATWDLMDISIYGGRIDYEIRWATNTRIHEPDSKVIAWDSPTTSLAATISATDTVVPRQPAGDGLLDLDDFPYRGTIRVEAEDIAYTSHTSRLGDSGADGVGGTNTLTDSAKSWTPEYWVGFALLDAAGNLFEITGNDATVLYVSGSTASGAYYIQPAFTGCTRGYGGTTAVGHEGGKSVLAESIGTRIGNCVPGENYNVSLRAIRFDGRISQWTPWQTVTTYLDAVPPADVVNFAVASTTTGVHLTWDSPTLIDTPDLAGFYIWRSDDDSGTNETYYGMIGARTEALVHVNHFNLDEYWCIQAVDTSGNTSNKTARLAGKKMAVAGQNLLPNSDFEIVSSGFPDFWTSWSTGLSVEILSASYVGGKSIELILPYGATNPWAYVQTPSPLSIWKVHAEPEQHYTFTMHFLTDFPMGSLVFDENDLVTGKALLSAHISSHNGSSTSTNASFVSTPVIISEFYEGPPSGFTSETWNRVSFTVQADPTLWKILNGYYYLAVTIVASNWATITDFRVTIDKVQLEMAGEASAWMTTGLAPPNSGTMRIEPTGIVGDNLYIMGDGKIASSLIPTPDLTQDLGATDARWGTLYADTIVADNIEDLLGDTHAAVTLDIDAETLLSLSTQELGLDSQAANLVFAGPVSGGATVPTFRSLVAGDIPVHGTTHNPGASDTLSTDAPDTNLSVSSTNDEGTASSYARSDHWHAITATSDPGATSALLKTNADGDLRLDSGVLMVDASTNRVGINNAAPSYPLDVAGNTRIDGDLIFLGPQSVYSSTGDLTVYGSNDLLLDAVSNAIKIQSAASIRSDAWTSGMNGTGWSMTYAGNLDCRYIYAEELVVDMFTALATRVHNGSILLTKDAAEVSRNFTVPAVSSTATLYIWDLPGLEDTQIFDSNDWVMIKYIDQSGGGLVVGEAWGQVTSYTNLTGGEQSYTWTTRSATSTGYTVYGGSIAAGYGVSGDGLWHATVVHSNSPYHQIQTWSGANPYTPGNFTTHVREGNLAGLDGSWGYGIYMGENTTNSYIRASSTGFEMHGIEAAWYDSSGNQRIGIDPTASGSSETLFWAGTDSGDKKLDLRANGDLYLSGTTIYGNGMATAIGTAIIHANFTGGQPYNTNYDVNTTDVMGQVASTANDAVTGRPGKFGKAVQVAIGVTNKVLNPVFGSSSQYSAHGSATLTRDSRMAYMSTYSLRVQTWASGNGVRINLSSLSNATHYMTFRAKGEEPTTIRLYMGGTDLQTATLLGYDAGWAVYGAQFSASQSSGSTYVDIEQYGAGSPDWWLDGIQVEQSAHATPVCHGGMPGASWSGTAHQSWSSRSAGDLTYDGLIPVSGTVSVWVYPTFSPSTSASNHRIVDGGYTSGILLYVTSSDTLSGYVGGAQRVSYSLSDTNFAAFEWHHIAMTWDAGEGVALYLDGVEVDTGSWAIPTDDGGGWDIGHYNGTYNWAGFLDDVVITDEVFDEEKISIIAFGQMPIAHTAGLQLMLTEASSGQVWGSAKGLFGVDDAGEPVWGLFTTDTTTWGGGTYDSGDISLGDPDGIHMMWDASAGQLLFYGGTAGGDAVAIVDDAVGFALQAASGVGPDEKLSFTITEYGDWATTMFYLSGYESGGYRYIDALLDTDSDAIMEIGVLTDSASDAETILRADASTTYSSKLTLFAYSADQRATFNCDTFVEGSIIADYPGSPYYGVAIDMADATAAWSRNFGFFDGSSTLRFAYGCYGNATALNYGWLGEAYNDTYMRFYDGGRTVIGNSAPNDTEMPASSPALMLHQGTGTGQAIMLHQTNVDHDMTSVIASSTCYGAFEQITGDDGGLRIVGLSEDQVWGVAVGGYAYTADSTTASSSGAPVALYGAKRSGSSGAALGNDENVLVVRSYTTTKMILKGDGDLYLTGSNAGSFDDYDDIALLHGLRAALAPSLGDRFGHFLDEARPILEDFGVATFGDDGSVWIGTFKLQMLTVDALRQFAEHTMKRLDRAEAALARAGISLEE